MYRIEQYRPAYFSGYDNLNAEFNTIEEFLNIDFVKNFTDIEQYEGFISEGFLIAEDTGYIFHIIYNPEQKRKEQWGVAKIIEGNVGDLKEMFFYKWKLEPLHKSQ